jgi:hypothetical protein
MSFADCLVCYELPALSLQSNDGEPPRLYRGASVHGASFRLDRNRQAIEASMGEGGLSAPVRRREP